MKKQFRVKHKREPTGGRANDLYVRHAMKNIRNTGPRRSMIPVCAYRDCPGTPCRNWTTCPKHYSAGRTTKA